MSTRAFVAGVFTVAAVSAFAALGSGVGARASGEAALTPDGMIDVYRTPNSCAISCPEGSPFAGAGAVSCSAGYAPVCQCNANRPAAGFCEKVE
jgi:hypothetical protein